MTFDFYIKKNDELESLFQIVCMETNTPKSKRPEALENFILDTKHV